MQPSEKLFAVLAGVQHRWWHPLSSSWQVANRLCKRHGFFWWPYCIVVYVNAHFDVALEQQLITGGLDFSLSHDWWRWGGPALCWTSMWTQTHRALRIELYRRWFVFSDFFVPILAMELFLFISWWFGFLGEIEVHCLVFKISSTWVRLPTVGADVQALQALNFLPRPNVDSNNSKGDTRYRQAVPVLVCLTCTLFKLSHGSSLLICSNMFVVGKSIVSIMLCEVVHALNDLPHMEMQWPNANTATDIAIEYKE